MDNDSRFHAAPERKETNRKIPLNSNKSELVSWRGDSNLEKNSTFQSNYYLVEKRQYSSKEIERIS